MDLKGIKTIVFDLGGVIITLNLSESIRRFKQIGLDNAEELLDPYHQKGIFLELENGTITDHVFFDAIRAEAGKYISDEDIVWAWLGFIQDVPEYKLRMLEDLRAKGYQLLLLSNTNPCVMSWALTSRFSPSGKSLADYFDKLYLSYQMGSTKPDPKIFHDMIEDAGLNPAETLFVDDGPANISIGKELGFLTYQPDNGEDFRHIFE